MITEDHVSFEIAKLLKEKGFNEECRAFYVKSKECGIELFPSDRSRNYNDDVYPRTSAPTLQMAMKWLREVHHIFLVVDYNYECTDKSYFYKVYHLGENGKPERFPVWGVGYDIEGNQHKEIISYRDFELSFFDYVTYEEACEAAIKYCLENLI